MKTNGKSYFNADEVSKLLKKQRDREGSPEWLIEVLESLPELSNLIPPEEDEKRFVVEYIYPH